MDLIRLDKNENPYGPSPYVYEEISRAIHKISSYPTYYGDDLIPKLSAHYNLMDDNILVGNGLDEIISLICQTFLTSTDTAISTLFTFPGYQNGVKNSKAKLILMPLLNYRISIDIFRETLAKNINTKIVFVCNPHNPTGTFLPKNELMEIITLCLQRKCICVIDEAYAEFFEEPLNSAVQQVLNYENLLILRTFSKAYGLAGLRIGYVLGQNKLIKIIEKFRKVIPFSVNVLAQLASISALNDQPYLTKIIDYNKKFRHFFYTLCDRKKIFYVPSITNFVLIKAPYASLYEDLLNRNIRVCNTESVGLLNHLRITIGNSEDMKKLENIFSELVGKDKANV